MAFGLPAGYVAAGWWALDEAGSDRAL